MGNTTSGWRLPCWLLKAGKANNTHNKQGAFVVEHSLWADPRALSVCSKSMRRKYFMWSSLLRFLVVADSVPQHIDLQERKHANVFSTRSITPCALFEERPLCAVANTSYFWPVIWYCRSNFSASSCCIHSHSSLAFSLWDTDAQQWDSMLMVVFSCVSYHRPTSPFLAVEWQNMSALTWVGPGSSFRCPEICVCHSGFSSSSLSQSASYRCVFRSAVKWNKT